MPLARLPAQRPGEARMTRCRLCGRRAFDLDRDDTCAACVVGGPQAWVVMSVFIAACAGVALLAYWLTSGFA